MRAWPTRYVTRVNLRDLYFQRWQDIANTVLAELLDDRETVEVWLRTPPWRRSWTFGVPSEVMHVLPVLHALLSGFIRAHDPSADIIVEADAHISWN